MVVNLAVEWYAAPHPGLYRDRFSPAYDSTLDIANLMLAPRLRTFTICCPKLKLQNFSMITRQAYEARKLDLILLSMEEFAEEDAAWLRELGHNIRKFTRLHDDGERINYWESRC